jgi:hypothetical protein
MNKQVREIKFRVWIGWGDTGKMIFTEQRVFKRAVGIIAQDDMVQQIEMSDFKGLFWMQFTGLKDKNNKDVYIGDLLQVKYEQDWQDGYYEVEDLRSFYLSLDTIDSYLRINEFIVKGNIYENPELLEVK